MLTCQVAGKLGRFANGAFQIISTIGVATKSGQPFAFPLWRNTDALERFGTTEDIDVYKHLVHPLPLIPEGMLFVEKQYTFGYHDIYLPIGNWSLWGHFQSDKYFAHCIDLVRYYMTFKDEIDVPYTAVHWRAGDYQEGENVYHPRLTMAYYEKALAEMPSNRPFLIFSDDIDGAKAMFGNNADYSEGNDYLTDFKLMKRCRNFVIANSSFSLLASILSEATDKKIVAPRTWWGPAWGSNYREMTKDIYPDGSIVI